MRKNMNIKTIYVMCVTFIALGTLSAKEITIDQKDKAFSITSVSVKVGDVIVFRNSDPFFHNIYSLSPIKIFDLGSYKQGESKSVNFDKPGQVEVNCAIHPSMKLKVTVEK
jgi:plastocyanin